MSIDLAIDVIKQIALSRKFGIEFTGEIYWWWPIPERRPSPECDPLPASDWWLLPKRTIKSMQRAILAAKRLTRWDQHNRADGINTIDLEARKMVWLARFQRRAKSIRRRSVPSIPWEPRKRKSARMEAEFEALRDIKLAVESWRQRCYGFVL
jgi:hypothetical protein